MPPPPDIVLLDYATRKPVRLTPFGSPSGESRPCRVAGRPVEIALVPKDGGHYKPEIGKKLRAMVDDGHRHDNIAFPTATLVEPHDNDNCYGVICPFIDGRSIDEEMAAVATQDEGAKLSLGRDIATCFKALSGFPWATVDNHKLNYIRKTQGGLVVRIDMPPLAGWSNGEFLPCQLAHPDYLEPELQGKVIEGQFPDRYSDWFSLAVLEFEALCGGHPAHFGWADMDVPERIAARKFVCHKGFPTGAVVPPGVKAGYLGLSDEMKVMFERAFLGDRTKRPSPDEWIKALTHQASQAPALTQPDVAINFPTADEVKAWLDRHWPKVAASVLVALSLLPTLSTTSAPAKGVVTEGAVVPAEPKPEHDAFKVLLQK